MTMILLLAACQIRPNEQKAVADGSDEALLELARTDLESFAEQVTSGEANDADRARALVAWLAAHLDWKTTDYQERTVREILNRGGGNCAELAQVSIACFQALNMPLRQVREINLHTPDEGRGERAKARIAEKGNAMSVFGSRHNDHVWIEIYDRATGEWFPADPSIGVVGEREWLAARFGFSERFTLDSSSVDMIAPFAVFTGDNQDAFAVDRTRYYVIEGFNHLYNNQLEALPAWKDWVALVEALDDPARGAFEGKVNLHDYSKEIEALEQVYATLKSQYYESLE